MRKVTILLGIFFLFSLFQISSHAKNTPQEEKNIKIVKKLIYEGYNKGNLAIADKYVTPDYVSYVNGVPLEKIGPEAVKENINYNHENYEFTLSVVNIFSKDDWCAVQWNFEGKQKVGGKKVKFTGVYLGHFVKGKLNKGMQFMDRLSQFEQLGYKLVPPEKEEAKK